ncbi:hypothetical protein EON65_35815 [archaeon]|nr:MAG: hypothetical protein EON65_35815 [archaeon]
MMLLLGLLLSSIAVAKADGTLPLWPLPWKYSVSNQVVGLSSTFTFTVGTTNLILDAAVDRYLKLISVPANAIGSLNSCQVSISDTATPKDVVSADESYDLNVDSTSCKISATTTWGALRGLETFSQLLSRVDNNVQLSTAPVSISDKARYDHRGLLVDTARHYQPVSEIKRIIDSMPANKMNVFHWHIVDAESFPVNTPSEPTMVTGAFSPSMTYTLADLQDVRTYALYRGVEVIIELDIPGHAASWTKGKKEVMADCFAKYYYNINDFALNPALDLTYITIQHILQDIVNATLSRYIHLGGDEVVYGCWKNDTSVVTFMQQNNIPSYDAMLGYFVQRVDKNVLGGDEDSPKTVQTVIHWEEVFTAQAPLDAANTIYQVSRSGYFFLCSCSFLILSFSIFLSPSL